MARWLAIALVLGAAACGHGSRGPAWPAMAKVDADHPDGGESLAPRHSTAVAAVEAPGVGDAELDALLAALAVVQEAAAGVTPTPAVPAAGADEPITTEDIIIEIGGDDGDDDGDD